MSFAASLDRLRRAVSPDNRNRSADGNRVNVQIRDLSDLLADWERLDAAIRRGRSDL